LFKHFATVELWNLRTFVAEPAKAQVPRNEQQHKSATQEKLIAVIQPG